MQCASELQVLEGHLEAVLALAVGETHLVSFSASHVPPLCEYHQHTSEPQWSGPLWSS